MGARELKRVFQADLPQGSSQSTLFIPSLDRNGRPIEQEKWVDEALHLLGSLFRGATAFPPGRGIWRDDSRGGALLEEPTIIITSYSNPLDHTPANLRELAQFLHRFGIEARQGEVGFIIDDQYFGISKYQRAERTLRRPRKS